ncbi:MAG TPA: T9SS type A sorting domain-containing protein [Ignavibacteriaceae bacterium]|nr:T9SS type A sorting domain-containing protein [Ignavibacteriaceae bacterium]
MLKKLNILFFIFFIGVWAQEYSPVAELAFPSIIPSNSSFDVSLITDNSILEAEVLKLYLISPNNLNINSVKVKTDSASKDFNILRTQIDKLSDNVFLTEINLLNEDLSINSFFQILLSLSSNGQEIIKLNIYGEFIKNEKVISTIGELTPAARKSERVLLAEIQHYIPGKFARNAARFESGTFLSIDLNQDNSDSLWIGFWLRLSGNNADILKMIDNSNDKIISQIHINQFQKLCVLDDNGSVISKEIPFLSRKTWNHIGILFDKNSNVISFYRNGDKVAKQDISGLLIRNDLNISFGSENSNTFSIEQLRILKPQRTIEKIFEDAKYVSSATSVKTFLQLNFNASVELTNQNNVYPILYKNIKYVVSDAPIISRAPELNISITYSYNQLEWRCAEINNISRFIVERSSAKGSFIEIGSIDAVQDISSSYNFIDESINKDEIVYYRIKQINKDGSTVYSQQIKVGMGNIEQFRLSQNYPNPFNPSTSIEIDLFEDAEIEVIVYNLEGQELVLLHKGFLVKGIHKFNFEADNLPSGVYLYKVSSPVFSQTKKMLLTK